MMEALLILRTYLCTESQPQRGLLAKEDVLEGSVNGLIGVTKCNGLK
jgi:hypothetical protein